MVSTVASQQEGPLAQGLSVWNFHILPLLECSHASEHEPSPASSAQLALDHKTLAKIWSWFLGMFVYAVYVIQSIKQRLLLLLLLLLLQPFIKRAQFWKIFMAATILSVVTANARED